MIIQRNKGQKLRKDIEADAKLIAALAQSSEVDEEEANNRVARVPITLNLV